MAKHPRLEQRGSVYWFRASIPLDIKDSFPKSEIRYSLRTRDYTEALKLLREASYKADLEFEAHRRQLKLQAQPPRQELTQEEIKRIGEIYYAHLLQEDETTRLDGFYDPDDGATEQPSPTFEEHVDDTQARESVDRFNQARMKATPFYMDEAEEVLSWSNVSIRLDTDSPAIKAVARELQKASLRASEAIRQRDQGDIVETPPEASDGDIQGVAGQGITLIQVFDKYVEEREPHERTVEEYRAYIDRFLQVFERGDMGLSEITPAHVRMFKEAMR